MKLSQMQDIAGCRVVMPNVELARRLYKEGYIQGDLKHKKVNEKDYINEALSLGAKGYLIKAHFTPNEVVDKVRHILRSVNS